MSGEGARAQAVSELLSTLNINGIYSSDALDHSIVINYDSPDTEGKRRELFITVNSHIESRGKKQYLL